MSQITKPIALDETLQDVVSAIQGITQGGMIVSTGNVGSATQPVYINGGVPTAGDVLAKYSSIKIQATAWDTYPNAHETRVYYYEGANTTTYNLPYQNVFVVVRWWSQDRAIARAFKWNKDSSTDPGYAMWINENHGVWQGWRQTYGITTGNATLNSQYISSGSITYAKSGNVVNVWIEGIVASTNGIPTGTNIATNLPKTALSRNRLWLKFGSTDYLFNLFNTGILTLGGNTAIPSGAGCSGSFTYITSD